MDDFSDGAAVPFWPEKFLVRLGEITRAALETPDLPTMLRTLANRLGELFGADGCYLTLWDEERGQVVPAAASGELHEAYVRMEVQPGEPTMTHAVLEAGRPLVESNTLQSPRISRRIAEHYPAHSMLALPLIAGETKLGAALVAFDGPHVFSADEIARGELVAGQISLAVAKGTSLAEARRRWQEAETLARAGAAVSGSLSLDETLARILEQLDGVLPTDSSSLQLLREGYMEIVAVRGIPAVDELVGVRFPVPADNVNTLLVQSGEPVVIEELSPEQTAVFSRLDLLVRSWMGVPLMAQERLIGMLTLDSNRAGYLNQGKVRLALPFANQAAIAIENARLFERAQGRVTELDILRRTSLELAATHSLTRVLEVVTESALELVVADCCHIYVYDAAEEALSLGTALWRDGRREPAVKAPRRDGVTMMVARSGEPLVINDAPSHPLYASEEARAWSVKAIAGFPLLRAGRVLGVFTITYVEPHIFDQDELRALTLLATQVAAAVENARLVEGLETKVAARTAEIAAEQERSEAILRSVGDAIAMLDLEARIQYVNRAFVELTGYPPAECLGRTLELLVEEGLRERVEQAVLAAVLAGEIWQGEMSVRRKDGRRYDAAVSAAAVRDAGGEVIGLVTSHRDVSQQKELERARGRFMSNVSHELRTPVTNIKLYAGLLQRGVPPEKQERYQRVLVEQAERLQGLVQDILTMTALDAGGGVRSRQPVDLAGLVAGTVRQYAARAEAAELTLEARPVPAGLPAVRGDPKRLGEALGELLENAVIFTPAGGTVTVETEQRAVDGRRWVTIAVRDTGPGIELDEQGRVFERFFRGRLAESGHVPGTGLGLSMAQEISQAHGGRVSLKSVPGTGSVFTLWLPEAAALPAR